MLVREDGIVEVLSVDEYLEGLLSEALMKEMIARELTKEKHNIYKSFRTRQQGKVSGQQMQKQNRPRRLTNDGPSLQHRPASTHNQRR